MGLLLSAQECPLLFLVQPRVQTSTLFLYLAGPSAPSLQGAFLPSSPSSPLPFALWA